MQSASVAGMGRASQLQPGDSLTQPHDAECRRDANPSTSATFAVCRAALISIRFPAPMKTRGKPPLAQPRPRTPGLTRRMVLAHAARLFRDVWRTRPLTPQEWSLAEEDLARKLERDGL